MAEVQQKDNGGGKGKQKKMTIRVDFTPMVDMIIWQNLSACRQTT